MWCWCLFECLWITAIDKINCICYTILNNKKGRKLNQKINTKACYL